MKKILIVLLTTASLYGEPFFYDWQLKTSANLYFSDSSEHKVSGASGITFQFLNLGLYAFATLPKTAFNDVQTAAKQKSLQKMITNERLAFSLNASLFKIPVKAEAGSITYSRVISRLKNPAPSVSGPLTQSFSFYTGTGHALPSLSSTKQPDSLYFEATVFQNSIPLLFQSAIIENGNVFCSILHNRKLSKFSSARLCFTGGRFYIDDSASILKKNKITFSKDFYNSCSIESFVSTPHLKVSLCSGLHQSPFGGCSGWIFSKGRIIYEFFLTDFSLYTIPHKQERPEPVPAMGIDSSVTKTFRQYSINPQFIFLTPSGNEIRTGFSAAKTWKISGTKPYASISVLKLSGGISYQTTETNIKALWTLANRLLTGEPAVKSAYPDTYYDYDLYLNGSIPRLKYSMSAGIKTFQNAMTLACEKKEYTSKLSLTPLKIPFITTAAQTQLTVQDGKENKTAVTLSFGAKAKKRHFYGSLKCEITMNY